MSTLAIPTPAIKTPVHTLTREAALRIAKRIVPVLLLTIEVARWGAKALTLVAVIGTYNHARMFLTDKGFGWLAWVVPAAFDLGFVVAAIVSQTPAVRKTGRRRAYVILAYTTLASGTLNAVAPGSMEAHIAFPALVVLAVGMEWMSAGVQADLAELERLEVAIGESVQPVARTLTEEQKATRNATRARNRALREAEEAEKAEQRRLRRERARERAAINATVHELERTLKADPAPVSPAPYGDIT